MAKLFSPISSLLVVMVGCWLMMSSSTEGTYFPFYYYGGDPYLNADLTADAVPVVINNYDSASGLNRPISLYSSVPPGYVTDDPTTINGRTFQAFANIFAGRGPFCRPCPTLTCPPVTCPTCKVCPVYPTTPSAPAYIKLTPATPDCVPASAIGTIADATKLGLCSRASSAPTGKIDVTFSKTNQVVIIAIVPVYPKTMVTLTCSITDAEVGTQNEVLTSDVPTKGEFIQLIALSKGDTNNKFECDWIAS